MEHIEDLLSPVVHSMKVKTDVGHYEPKYERIILDLHEDGTVTWRDHSIDQGY